MRRFEFLSLFFLMAGLSSFYESASAGEILTLEKTLAHVYSSNPVLEAGRAGQEATKELYPQAQAGWRPALNAETSIISSDIDSSNFSNGDGATTKSAAINIEQPLFRGFRTTGETRAAQNRIAAGAARIDAQAQDIFVAAVEAYMDVIAERKIVTLEQKNMEILTKEAESVLARFEAGELTRTDVKQMESRIARARADIATAQSRMVESEARFEALSRFAAPETMAMPAVPFSFPKDFPAFMAMAEKSNPALSRARREHLAAQDDITVAESSFYPQIAAFASHIREYDPQPGIVEDSETSQIGVRARIALYEGGAATSRTREAKHRANQRLIQVRAEEASVKQDLTAQWRRYRAFEEEIVARKQEIDAALFSSEGVREEARLGERTVLETLEAEQDVLDAQKSLVSAERGRIVTAYRLAASLGLLTPKALGLAPL